MAGRFRNATYAIGTHLTPAQCVQLQISRAVPFTSSIPRTWIIRAGAIVGEAEGFGGDIDLWTNRVAEHVKSSAIGTPAATAKPKLSDYAYLEAAPPRPYSEKSCQKGPSNYLIDSHGAVHALTVSSVCRT